MDRNYDEVIAEMLIQLEDIERRMGKADRIMEKFDKRLDLTIRRMVKAESRLEAQESRMMVFDAKLDQSIKDQMEFSKMQSNLNQYFLEAINKKNGR